MSRGLLIGMCVMLGTALGACALFRQTPQERAKQIEPMLSAAGFNMVPADNPDKLKGIQSLPPLKIRYYTANGQLHYWFADPDYCRCVYTGNEAAYQQYEKLKLQSQMVQQEQMAAEANEDAAEEMMMPGPFMWGVY